jgi:hypothetical protein
MKPSTAAASYISAGMLFMPVLWHDERAICALAFLVDDRKKSYNFWVFRESSG